MATRLLEVRQSQARHRNMKQVTARELEGLDMLEGEARDKEQYALLDPDLLARLVATIRHLRTVVRKKRDFTIT
jgi:hypothetical protein